MQPQPRLDRWLALAMLLVPLTLIHVLVIHPFWVAPMRSGWDQLVDLRQRQLRVQAEIDQADQVAEQFFQIHQQLAGVPGFLPQSSSEQAAAALLQQVDQVVGQVSPGNASCLVTARTPLPTEAATQEAFVRVSVQLRLRCGAQELAKVLHQLETGDPRLFIDNLTLLSQRHQVLPGESGAGLDAAFDVYGYLDPAAAAPAVTEVHNAD